MLFLKLWNFRDTKCLWLRTPGVISATMGSLVLMILKTGLHNSNKLWATWIWKLKTTESFGWTLTHSVITTNASTSIGTRSFSHTARASSIYGKWPTCPNQILYPYLRTHNTKFNLGITRKRLICHWFVGSRSPNSWSSRTMSRKTPSRLLITSLCMSSTATLLEKKSYQPQSP